MYTEEELFTNSNEYNSFHDVLIDIYKFDYTVNQMRKIFNKLPIVIRDTAHCWGLSDTVFRDDAYVYLQRNLHIIKELHHAKNQD